jgi:3-phenylpropionate/trans-cinnamate dioxygenase ferredoxin subunit
MLSAPDTHLPHQGIRAVSEYFEAGFITELKEGTMKKIMVRDHPILLAMALGHYYAVDALCPHLKGDLSKGSLQGTVLTCPMHHSRFDIRDGHVIRWTDLTGIRFSIDSRAHPPRPLKYYPVRVEGEKILISLDKF